MKRNRFGLATFLALISALPLTPFAAGCSGTSNTGEAKAGSSGSLGTGAGGAGGHAGVGAAGQAGAIAGAGHGGTSVAGATGDQGGAFGSAGKSGSAGTGNAGGGGAVAGGGSGGTASCLDGAVCNCDTLTGVTKCTAAGPKCTCPPAAQCQIDDGPKCFTPCGGDPFGAWVLESSCFATTASSTGACHTDTQGTPGNNDLRMRILDGGNFELYGTEDWSTTTRISLECNSLSSTNACSSAYYGANIPLFSYMPQASCTPSACGACDCASSARMALPASYPSSQWSRSGNNLTLGAVAVPYCVQGDELWIGGTVEGRPRAAYKFKKQSCVGTPLACPSRTMAACEVGQDCTLGLCKATTGGSAVHCATAFDEGTCSVFQGCVWDPNSCSGDANTTCDFASCPAQPGCAWGPPKETCIGDADCSSRDVTDCSDLGCSVSNCQPFNSDDVDCAALGVTDCPKAPGCHVTNGVCAGQTLCSKQTDANVCSNLACSAGPFCAGNPTPCPQLSLTDCTRMPGCQLVW